MIGDILQPTHLLFVLVIALLVLGPKRLPEVGRSLGRGIRDFKSAMGGDDDRPEELLSNMTGRAETSHEAADAPEPAGLSHVTTEATHTSPTGPAGATPDAVSPTAPTMSHESTEPVNEPAERIS